MTPLTLAVPNPPRTGRALALQLLPASMDI